jgi:hypothetical protein
LEDDLVAWGRVLRVETRGRMTGRVASATSGQDRPDGALVVAASSPETHRPTSRPTGLPDHDRRRVGRRARELEGPERAAAVRDLILRYGTPAESLGAGPAFEITRPG